MASRACILVGLCLLACACLGEDFDLGDPVGQSLAKTLTNTLTPWPTEITALRFGVPPIVDQAQMEDAYGPLAEYLGERLGVPTTLVQASSYADLGRLVKEGQVDLALFTSASYVQAEQHEPTLTIILKQVSNGAPAYLGYVYCDADLPATELEDLRGHSICFVDALSTSGYLYPRMLIKRRGLDPDAFFSKVVFGGNHLACLKKVMAGECDAGATWAGAFTLARDEGLKVHRLRILAKTPWIPFNALAIGANLPSAAGERIAQELLGLNTRSPDGQRVISHAMRLNAWVVVSGWG